MRNLKGMVAIVTGGGKGIGKAIVKQFLEDECAGVAILQRNLDVAEATAKELDPTGEKVIALKCDVSKDEDCKACVEAVVAKFGKVDILVNNAGITRDKIFHKMADEDWHMVININLTGMYNMTKYVVPYLREQESGNIINITSTSMMGNPGQANYAAAKAGMVGFTRTLGKEMARKNVRVNAIAPGFIETEMMLAIGPEKIEASKKRNPMQRIGDPSEIASVAAFLASEDASWVTGQTIIVSGGALVN